MLAEMLNRVAENLRLSTSPTQDKKGAFSITLGGRQIKIQDLDPGVYFWANLSEVPNKDREELFILLMKANFLGQGTGDCVIGMDHQEKFLTLSSQIAYEVNYEIFKEKLEDFVNYLDYWYDEVVKQTRDINLGQ